VTEVTKNGIIEALIFSSPSPISAKRIASIAALESEKDVDSIVDLLNTQYEKNGRAFRIRKIAGGYQFFSIVAYAPYIGEIFVDRSQPHLTRAMLEVLSIIAVKQPVTKPVIDSIRGADSGGSIHTLLEKGIVTVKGRQKSPGRPFMYATTRDFLKLFGISDINELPSEDELPEFFGEEDFHIPQLDNPEEFEDKPEIADSEVENIDNYEIQEDGENTETNG